MSAALLVLAAGLLTWPARLPVGRRLRAPALPRGRALLSAVYPPSPALAGGTAAALAAVLSTPVVALLAGGCAALAVRAVHSRRAVAGEDARLLLLADALGAVVGELRSGRSPARAAGAAASACPDRRTGRLLLGALAVDGPDPPVSDAEVTRVRAAVRLSARTGCSLADVLAALEDDLRARHRQRLALRTGTAGPRAGAGVLAALPLLGLAMGAGVGADPWHVLTATVAGQVLLVIGVALEVAGVGWMARLVRRATSGAGADRA